MAASSSRITLDLLRSAGRCPSVSKRARTAAASTTSRRIPSSQHVISRRCLHSTSPVAEEGGRGRKEEPRFNFNTSLYFTEDADPDHINYRRVTATELRSRREPPTKVKMLVRDFIDDSLYNPHYGYFSKNATIFAPPEGGYDFSQFKDQVEFEETVAAQYVEKYGRDSSSAGGANGGSGRQVWHTPTELFKPYYAQSLTSAILESYKVNQDASQDLIIYELGAGNGSFMLDSLRYLRKHHPEVFARTKYRIIEISAQLAKRQRVRAKKAGLEDHVEIVESDFFKWEGSSSEPCYVVANEVLDNFAHDMIRYDLNSLAPLQAVVVIDSHGEFTLLYEPLTDPLLRRCFDYRESLPRSSATLPTTNRAFVLPFIRKAFTALPFAPNLSKPDFIPSKATLFLERLRERLPQHRLLVADFSDLPDTVPGRNGPVVQTRVGNEMVPCETFLVKQGYFDIFFPTDFKMLKETYELIMRSPPDTVRGDSLASQPGPSEQTPVRDVVIYGQDEFMRTYGGPEMLQKLTTKDGVCVVDRMYGNARVMF